MSIISRQSLFAASVVVAQLIVSPAFAQSTPKLEKEQLGNSAAPDVDPGASKGTDKSSVKQERDQIGKSTAVAVDPNASQGTDKSIVKQEQDQIPH